MRASGASFGISIGLLSFDLPNAQSFAGLPLNPASRYVVSHGRTRKGPPLARPVSGRPDASPFAGVDVAPEDLTRLHDEVSGGSVLGNSALVAGNMIGAGVLALPAVTSGPGFILSSTAMLVVWGYCLATGMLVAECAGEGRDSIQEMADASVGRTAGNVMCAAFLASNYLLMVAYISQGASLLSGLPLMSSAVCGPFISTCVADAHVAPLVFTAIVGTTSLWGPARFVENANTALVALIALSFAGLMATGVPNVDVASLGLIPNAPAFPAMLPVALCALTFQNVVPAVSKNLKGDSIKIRSSLAIGSGLPLITYILWNAVVLGSTSGLGGNSIIDSASVSASPMDALAASSPLVGSLVSVFSMSAIVTSFWGAAFSLMIECTHLVDNLVSKGYLSDTKGQFPMVDDSRSIEDVAQHDENIKTAASALVLMPPVMVSMACPDSFFPALEYVGIYIDPLLYGLAPVFMAYRFRRSDAHKIQLPGGSAVLALIASTTGVYMCWQTILKMS